MVKDVLYRVNKPLSPFITTHILEPTHLSMSSTQNDQSYFSKVFLAISHQVVRVVKPSLDPYCDERDVDLLIVRKEEHYFNLIRLNSESLGGMRDRKLA